MELKLYGTYERRLRPFAPLETGRAGLYACGPTVYDYAHIGNLRTYRFIVRDTAEGSVAAPKAATLPVTD
jgi:cysteinyl-tRNA synthetase